MSRTDKTDPWWTQGTWVPVHDHSRGACTLPANPPCHHITTSYRHGKCHWTKRWDEVKWSRDKSADRAEREWLTRKTRYRRNRLQNDDWD